MSTIHLGLSLRNHSRGYNADGRRKQNPHTSCAVLQSAFRLKNNLLYSFKVITLYLQCFLFQTDFLWLLLNTFWGIIDLFDFWGGRTLYCHSHRKFWWTWVSQEEDRKPQSCYTKVQRKKTRLYKRQHKPDTKYPNIRGHLTKVIWGIILYKCLSLLFSVKQAMTK